MARIRRHSDDPKFVRLGDKLEKLREQPEQGLINSIEFLKMLLELAREAAQAEKEVVPEEEVDKGKAALTELFNGVKNTNTPVIVERIVTDIDDIVKIVRFEGWQNTTGGRQEVKKALRSVVFVRMASPIQNRIISFPSVNIEISIIVSMLWKISYHFAAIVIIFFIMEDWKIRNLYWKSCTTKEKTHYIIVD